LLYCKTTEGSLDEFSSLHHDVPGIAGTPFLSGRKAFLMDVSDANEKCPEYDCTCALTERPDVEKACDAKIVVAASKYDIALRIL
jgi:hypothetical protein